MFELPKSMLGDVSGFTITSPDPAFSFSFYRMLGFREMFRHDMPFPFILISDGAVMMMIRQDPVPYFAITYYVREIDKVIGWLEHERMKFIFRPGKNDLVRRYVMQSPDALNISFVQWTDGFVQPAGKTMLTMQQSEIFDAEKYTNKIIGMFGEVAHPVSDLNFSIGFWERMGFQLLSKFESPYPWAIVSDGLHILGLHQSSKFSYPAMTFFASDMPDKIDRLKGMGLSSYVHSGSGNIIVTTPENQHINLFKLGM